MVSATGETLPEQPALLGAEQLQAAVATPISGWPTPNML
jgi:hypothetical protein